MVVDGEDSSEEDIDTIKHGSSGASPTNSSRTALEYKAANFMPEPQNPIVGSLQERLLPSAQQQLDLLAQLSHEHEQLLRLVNRERQTVDGLCQDMQDAQEVLQKVPSYEVKLKTMMQQMQRIWDTIQEVSYQSTQAEKQLRLESEVNRVLRKQCIGFSVSCLCILLTEASAKTPVSARF